MQARQIQRMFLMIQLWIGGIPLFGLIRAWRMVRISFLLPALFQKEHRRQPAIEELRQACGQARCQEASVQRMLTDEELRQIVLHVILVR